MSALLLGLALLGEPARVSFSALVDHLHDDVVVDPDQVPQKQADVPIAAVAARLQYLLQLALAEELGVGRDEGHDLAEVELEALVLCDAFEGALLLLRLGHHLATRPRHAAAQLVEEVAVVEVQELLHLLDRRVHYVVGRETGLRLVGANVGLRADVFGEHGGRPSVFLLSCGFGHVFASC